MIPAHFRSWIKDTLLLTLGLSLLFGLFLGTRALSVPDEARYAEIPREMIELSDYITPHLNYIKYFEKPPLLYWFQTASIKLFGYSEWALRLPTALLGLLGCLMMYAAARALYDRGTGIFASIILATSLLYFGMAHLITLDMTVTFFLTSCLFCFVLGIQPSLNRYRRPLFWGCYLSAGLALLAKGLIGVLLPGFIIFSWLLIYREWRQLSNSYLLSGLALFSLVAIPWHYWVQKINPEFFQFYFIEQHFSRYFTMSAGRYKPDWFFIGILLLGFFPWTVFLPQAVYSQKIFFWKTRLQTKKEGFFLLWAVIIFGFFSLSKSKLIPYILPAFPPLALLTGRYLSTLWESKDKKKGITVSLGLLFIFAIPLSVALVLLPYYQTVSDVHTAHLYLRSLGLLLLLTTSLTGLLYWRKHIKAAFITLIVGTVFQLILLVMAVPSVETRSIKPLAETLQKLLRESDEIVSYRIYFQDLPFYLQRKVTIVDWKNELTFGMQHQDTHQWMIEEAEFRKRWRSPQKIFAVMPLRTYRQLQQDKQLPLIWLQATPDNVLVTNQAGARK